MKRIIPLLCFATAPVIGFSQKIEDANLHVSNISSNVWFEKYDDSKRVISNLNFMALCEGHNSEYRTNPFVIKLYLYNKERYDATKEVYYIKTYEVPYIKHFGSWEVKNGTVNFCDMDIEPGVYRLGFYIDADQTIKESNENDNMVLFEGELVIKEKTCAGGGNSTTDNSTNTNQQTTPTADPDQAIKDQKTAYENQLVDLSKKITTLEYDINQNKASLTPIDLKIKEVEKQELELRREECKVALERTNKSLDKSLTPDDLQKFTSKEQDYKLKADALQKQRNELINLKNSNAAYAQKVKDLPSTINTTQNELTTMPQNNLVDSIDYKIKKLQLEEFGYRYEAAKIGLEKTNKQIDNSLAVGAKPHAESAIQELGAKEEDYNQKVAIVVGQIQEQNKAKKDAEKAAKKSANQEKMDNSKLKVKIKSLTSQIKMKENALAKEQKKKKQDATKIEALQREIDDLKKELEEAEKQLK